jgi:NADH-quinone oxidoreductase subunit N
VLLSLVGAFYYLRVVKAMYFDDPVDTSKIEASNDMRVTLSINGLAVLLLGVLPGPLMTACAVAIVKTLAS